MRFENYYPENISHEKWLPTSKKEVDRLGWDNLDVILFSGDAYIDHPAFGIAIIGRVLERLGLKVGIVPQPNWQDDLRDFKKLGQPKLFFGITSGNMDSMVNHYTANKRLRSNDAYTPGGKNGHRPDRATSVYAQILRSIFPSSIIVAGGVEASMRRLTHYDYWSNELKPSLLTVKDIDYILYGNSERTVVELVKRLQSGASTKDIREIPQLAFSCDKHEKLPEFSDRRTILLDSFEEELNNKLTHASNFKIIEEESNTIKACRLIQETGNTRIVVNPPFPPSDDIELDSVYELPFTRFPHPKYWRKPIIPAFEMIRFSITTHRGCFGGCSFCTISMHQGKHISNRSESSIIQEIQRVNDMPGFKGYISDLGGPSANMYNMNPINRDICLRCKRPSCVHPDFCPNISVDHSALLKLYKKARQVSGIKKVIVSSGIRYDLFLRQQKKYKESQVKYPEELIKHHISGRIKVAPEHSASQVLKFMRKPAFQDYKKFSQLFYQINKKHHLKQQIIPYFIASHPGCSLEDMALLAADARSLLPRLEQIQDFTPTPMTLATVMYYSGIDPYSKKTIQSAKSTKDRQAQRSFFFWHKTGDRQEILKNLKRMGREDLISKILSKRDGGGF